MEALEGGSISLACEDTEEMHDVTIRKTSTRGYEMVIGDVLGWGSRELMTQIKRIHLYGIWNNTIL